MPYIDPDRRYAILLYRDNAQTPGELNFRFTMTALDCQPDEECDNRLRRCAEIYLIDKKISYTLLNEVMGAFICALMELRRRRSESLAGYMSLERAYKNFYRDKVVPYEEMKIIENGDVY